MTEFWAGFFYASLGIIAGAVAIPYLGLLVARKLREWSRTPEEKEGANRPAPLLRKGSGELEENGRREMKYRAILIDPGNSNQERPIQTLSNSLEVIREWAYGGTEGGMERARGVLPSAISEDARVDVYAIEERLVNVFPKRKACTLPPEGGQAK